MCNEPGPKIYKNKNSKQIMKANVGQDGKSELEQLA